MANITLDLSQFKASGIYTLEFDASQSVTIDTQTTRLVVGSTAGTKVTENYNHY